MAQPTLPTGLIRSTLLFDGSASGAGEGRLQVNPQGHLEIAQALPEDAECARLGLINQVALSTGVNALTALPTTVNGIGISNVDPNPLVAYLIHSIGVAEEVIDATQADTTALFAMNNVVIPGTAPLSATSLTARKTNGRKYGGAAVFSSGATVVNDGWFAHGGQAPLAPAVAGAIWKVTEVLVRGMYVVRQGGSFHLQAVKAAAAASQMFHFIRWIEIPIALA